MHQPIDTPQNPVPTHELTIANVGRALAQLTYEQRKGTDPSTRVDEETYAQGLVKLYMGEWTPTSTSPKLCPLSLLVGKALMTASFIRAHTTTNDEDHIVRGDQ